MVPGSMTGNPCSNSLLSKVLIRLSLYGFAGVMDFLGGCSTDGGRELSFMKDPEAYTEAYSLAFIANRGFCSTVGGKELSFIKDPDAYTEAYSLAFIANKGFSSLTGELVFERSTIFADDYSFKGEGYFYGDGFFSSSLNGELFFEVS